MHIRMQHSANIYKDRMNMHHGRKENAKFHYPLLTAKETHATKSHKEKN